jgi:hypothetical protein
MAQAELAVCEAASLESSPKTALAAWGDGL